jgi:hypothetical protein
MSGAEEEGAGKLLLALRSPPHPENSKATSATTREAAIIPGLNLFEFI